MKINEYGDRDRPHILLIHGMKMCHEMMLPYVAIILHADILRENYEYKTGSIDY